MATYGKVVIVLVCDLSYLLLNTDPDTDYLLFYASSPRMIPLLPTVLVIAQTGLERMVTLLS